MSRRRSLNAIATGTAAAGLLALNAGPTQAHHAMGGAQVTTFAEGLFSGLAHPVIGIDHLAFALGVGILAALVPQGARLIAAFLAASFAGIVLHLARVGLPFVEPAIAATVLAAGALLIAGGVRKAPLALALALLGGIVHGYALAESIVGVEATPLAAYLIGLTIVQGVIMVGASVVAGILLDPAVHGLRRVRVAGSILCLAGAGLLAAPLLGV